MYFNNLSNNFPYFSNYSYPQCRPEPTYTNDNTSIIINNLLRDEYNYYCFDCHRKTNGIKYFDIKNAIFLCYNCAVQHSNMSKEITEIMTGDIHNLDERYLLLLYYGGNQNLTNFIRRNFPLLEKMDKRKIYSTKAMDYYRKLIRAKSYNEPEPYLPRRLEGYNSIFNNVVDPANEGAYMNNRNEEEKNNDVCHNRNWKNGNVYYNTKTEPAVINNDDDDIEMKDETGNYNNANKGFSRKNEKEGKDRQKGFKKKEVKNENQTKNKNNKNKNEKKISNSNSLNINQIGELSMYPDAQFIDGLDCE